MKNTSNLRNNNSATVAPTATDDSTLGYNVGSIWVDTTANEGYVCVDSSATAAIWSNISGAANLFTANLNLLANRSHTLNDKEFKFDINNSSTNIIGNSRFSSAGIVGFLNDTSTNVVNSYNINSTDITFIADSPTTYTSLVVSPGSIALSEGSSDIAIDGISVMLSSGNGGLSIGSVGTANTLYQDNSTNKYGILLNGFGETSETNGTGANYTTLVDTSLVPKKYVDDAISGIAITSIYTANDTIGAGRFATLTDTITFGVATNNSTTINSAGQLDVKAVWRANKGTLNLQDPSTGFVGVGLSSLTAGYYGGFFYRPSANYLTIGSNVDGVAIEPTANNQAYVFKSNQFLFSEAGIIGNSSKLGSAILEVKGADTLGTSSALQIYDGDGTPSVLWDFRNNGDILQGVASTWSTNNNALKIFNPVNLNATLSLPVVSFDREMSSSSAVRNFIDGGKLNASDGNYFKIFGSGNGSSGGISFFNRRDMTDSEITYSTSGIYSNQIFDISSEVSGNKILQLYSGTSASSGNGFLKFWDRTGGVENIKIARSGLNFINPDSLTGVGGSIVLMGNSLIGTEDISLQGSTIIQGEGTSTGSTLALYDNDTTPYKRFEILDNGQFRLDSSNAVVATPFKIEMRPIGGTGTPPYFMIKNYGEVEIYGGLSNLFNVQNTLGAKQFEVLNGTTKINGASQINSTWFQVLTDTQKMSFNAGSGGALHHEIKTNGGGGAITTRFNIPGGSYQFIVGASAIIGTEKISLQGDTLIDGSLDMNNNRITKAVINPSVQEAANAATFTINSDQETDGVLTAMSANTTIAAPTGTPVQSQSLVFRFKDDGSARTLTWNAIFRAIGVTLPTTTTASKLLYVGCKYNSTDTKWDVVSVQEEA